MSTTNVPRFTGTDRAPKFASASDGLAPRTDEGLRQKVRAVDRSGSWDQPAGRRLLDEIRRRAVRNAARVAASTGVPMSRGLVDDVLLAAWTVLHRHGDKVLAAERPWAYLMCSAQKQVVDEVRAQQLLTDTASIRGRAREVLPEIVRPVGTTASDLAAAFRHESRGEDAGGTERQVVPQIGRHDQAPLVASPTTATGDEQPAGREAWFVAFVDLLVDHGADKTVTVAAVDRLADLFAVSYVGGMGRPSRPDSRLPRLVPGSVRRPRRLVGRLAALPAQRQARQPAGRCTHRHREQLCEESPKLICAVSRVAGRGSGRARRSSDLPESSTYLILRWTVRVSDQPRHLGQTSRPDPTISVKSRPFAQRFTRCTPRCASLAAGAWDLHDSVGTSPDNVVAGRWPKVLIR